MVEKKQVAIRMTSRAHENLRLLADEFSTDFSRNVTIGEVVAGLARFAMDDENIKEKSFKKLFKELLIKSILTAGIKKASGN